MFVQGVGEVGGCAGGGRGEAAVVLDADLDCGGKVRGGDLRGLGGVYVD